MFYCSVIEAQIPMREELESKTLIQFPDTSTNDSLVFGNMTPMIEIPTTIVLRQREEEGVFTNIHMYVCNYVYACT